MSSKQCRQNRGFNAESVARCGCGTINRYGQLLESTSRVQFAVPRHKPSVDARSRGEEKGQGNEESPREAEGWEGDYPDIHHTLFFILHYPCSTPLYSIMPAPRINDESYQPPPPPPTHPTRTAICPSGYSSSSLCATAINTSPSAVARLSNEKSTLLYADRFIIRIKLRQSVSFDQFEVNFSLTKFKHNYYCCLILIIKSFDEIKLPYENYNSRQIARALYSSSEDVT